MSRCNQRNAFPNEGRHDADYELVDRPLIQEGPDDLASAHQPDVLASLLAHALRKGPNRFRHKLDTGRHRRGRGVPRKHIMHVTWAKARTHLHTLVEGFAAKDLGVDGAREFRQTVEAFGSRTPRQPIEIAIRSSDVAVSARRNI